MENRVWLKSRGTCWPLVASDLSLSWPALAGVRRETGQRRTAPPAFVSPAQVLKPGPAGRTLGMPVAVPLTGAVRAGARGRDLDGQHPTLGLPRSATAAVCETADARGRAGAAHAGEGQRRRANTPQSAQR